MNTTKSVHIEGRTIVDALRNNVRRIPDRPALRSRVASGWETMTYADYGRAVAEVTAGLAELGIAAGQHVGIFSNNRAEWHLADFGILANGCVTVPVYQTSSPEQVAYTLGHGEANVCFVEDHALAARILEVKDELPKLDRIVTFDNHDRLDDPLVLGFSELRALGAARLVREPGLFDARADAVRPESLATLVYTSGTTGRPKGAMVSHANIMWTLESAVSLVHIGEGERLLSFLPLSHIAERMMSDFAAVAVGAETWFARSLSTVAEDLRDCRPTVFFAVPRVWEKLQEAVSAKLDDTHGLKKVAVSRYVDLGERVVADRESTGYVPAWERLPYAVLDAAVGAKIRHEIGLDEARVLIWAAAPIHPDLIRWFHAIGLPLLELYGQTEACGPTTCNPPEDNRVGTVGPPIPGARVRIADDGEILVQGGNVCMGYLHDRKATAELIDDDGWMHTGDVGRLDSAGYLTVTGRKKDLIITAHGQNIAPQDIEMDLRHHDLISEAVVTGEGRRYLTALLTLDGDALAGWADANHKVGGLETLALDPDLRAEIDRWIDAVNSKRSRVEHIRKYHILAHDFTVAAGEMTPTLKVKRNIVNADYRDEIDAMYAGKAEVVVALVNLREVVVDAVALDRLALLLGPERAERFACTAQDARVRLSGRRVVNVNSTATGGGVAELLQTLLAYAKGAGVDARWVVVDGDARFFEITKRIHNHLYGTAGDGGPLGAGERRHYDETMRENAAGLLAVVRPGDIVILHDPQTTGLARHLAHAGVGVVWRCHIGIDTQNEHSEHAWAFLRRDLDDVDAYVFSRAEFAPSWIPRDRLVAIPPSIDPFSAKNVPIEPAEVVRLLQRVDVLSGADGGPALTFPRRDGTRGQVVSRVDRLGTGPAPPPSVPIVLQASRWDAMKDMQGVMIGFADSIASHSDAHLVLAGPEASGVSDDPEAGLVLRDCLDAWTRLPDAIRRRVHLVCVAMADGDEAASIVNALQRHATVVVQKSLAEGFGLTVTEAMWKERPVVAGAVGGIVDQIVHGQTGWLVDPLDLDQYARSVCAILGDADCAKRMGTAGRERVRDAFLGDRHLEQWAQIFERLV